MADQEDTKTGAQPRRQPAAGRTATGPGGGKPTSGRAQPAAKSKAAVDIGRGPAHSVIVGSLQAARFTQPCLQPTLPPPPRGGLFSLCWTGVIPSYGLLIPHHVFVVVSDVNHLRGRVRLLHSCCFPLRLWKPQGTLASFSRSVFLSYRLSRLSALSSLLPAVS